MAWPNDTLSDADMNSEQDRPPRAMIRNMLLAVKSIIASRGARRGIASLDTNGHVPATQINGLAMTRAERAKLAGIEAGARADQTASELRAAIGTAGTGLITSAERTKLAGIEAGATADQTGAQIRAALDAVLGTGWRTQIRIVLVRRSGSTPVSAGNIDNIDRLTMQYDAAAGLYTIYADSNAD